MTKFVQLVASAMVVEWKELLVGSTMLEVVSPDAVLMSMEKQLEIHQERDKQKETASFTTISMKCHSPAPRPCQSTNV